MDSLISVINKLQNIFHIIGEESLSLPQIVVVGDQSSGKSSVIENILGRSFLPKGTGIMTRQPLVLQLINISEDEKSLLEEYGVFQHKKNVLFTDFNEIRREIESITNSKVGRNKEISDEPICLSIYSKKVVNITLIDLPGLTKIPVGNQPPDIEMRIRALVARYISNPNSIILAVVTANTDMTTSESLKQAKKFDREGNRTIAVVTKLDLMDSGTDATDILSGRIVPVKLGIIGVVNRSQKDTMADKPISEAIRDEEIFLQRHYPAIAFKHGTPYLTQRLNEILREHIKNCLPDLKLRLNNVKAQTLAKLNFFGEDVVDGSRALLNTIAEFCSSFCSVLDGTSRQIETSKLSGGARICYIFHETFGKALDYIQPLAGLTKCDILTAMRNSTGTRPSLFVPETCFELLVKKQIVRLLDPSLKCVELIHGEMQEILRNSWNESHKEMIRFPKLYDRIITTGSEIIRRRLNETNAMVENLIQVELAYINTMHPEFRKNAELSLLFHSHKRKNQTDRSEEEVNSRQSRDSSPSTSTPSVALDRPDLLSLGWFSSFLSANYISKISKIPQNMNYKCEKFAPAPGNVLFLSEKDRLESEAVEKLVANYFNIVKKSIRDKVPKTIMHFLVNFVKENIQRELVEVLYKIEEEESLFEEPEEVKFHRQEQKFVLKTLEHVDSMLTDLRDVTSRSSEERTGYRQRNTRRYEGLSKRTIIERAQHAKLVEKGCEFC